MECLLFEEKDKGAKKSKRQRGQALEVNDFQSDLLISISGQASTETSTDISSSDTSGNSTDIDETSFTSSQVQGTIHITNIGQETITYLNDQIVAQNETDTTTIIVNLSTTSNRTTTANNLRTQVDPLTGLVTTTSKGDSGSTANRVQTISSTTTIVHTESLGTTPIDVITTTSNETTQQTATINQQQTTAWLGTDAQGITYDNRQTVSVNLTITDTTTDTESSTTGTQVAANAGTIWFQ